jgi:hypothetical protein
MAKKTRYNKLIITANALVKRGAVQETAIFKELTGLVKAENITKVFDDKLEMHSIMYMLNKEDAHGCLVEAQKALDDACLDFMENGEKRLKMTHDGDFVNAKVMQLYIVPKGHPIWSDEKYIGAIASVTKFLDPVLYEQMKDENWETSIEGQAEEEVIEKSMIEDLKDFIKNLFAKSQNNNYIKEDDEVILHDQTVKKGIDMSEEQIKALIMAMKAEIMAELKPEKEPEVPVEDAKPAEPADPMPDPEKEELKKQLEKLKADLEKEVKKSVQIKEVADPEKEVKKQFSMFN